MFSYLAGLTHKIEFDTGILILPQRQTALVAKQAATLDVLSNGRLRLGVGNGWNEIEYIAQGEDFHNRGKRIEEQVALLRLLWTQPLVKFEGRWHIIPDAGINPLPVQRPIPIWFGGTDDRALRRMARIGDGWMVNFRTIEQAQPAVEKLKLYLEEAGREKGTFGIEPRLNMNLIGPDGWMDFTQACEQDLNLNEVDEQKQRIAGQTANLIEVMTRPIRRARSAIWRHLTWSRTCSC